MPKIHFIAAHRYDRSPSQRFRFEQYFTFLEENGFQCELLNLLSEKDDAVFYKKGKYFQKLKILIRSFYKRKNDVKNVKKTDIVFIQREAFMTGSTRFERKFKKTGAKIIFDFDDSIWLFNVSDANKSFKWLKNAEKTASIISLADMIFAGNNYLASYAKQFNSNIKIVPTTIDTNQYKRLSREKNNKICIGWSGSITTIKHFSYALPFLELIKQKYGDLVTIKVIGDANYVNSELNIQGIGWNKDDELQELCSFDIGIMPLPDDEWAKGKCGLKGLQYMALEIPTIMSPVGVNSQIIVDGKNGFLASTINEWVAKLSLLIESESIRKTMGSEARKTVELEYSVESQKNNYLNALKELIVQ